MFYLGVSGGATNETVASHLNHVGCVIPLRIVGHNREANISESREMIGRWPAAFLNLARVSFYGYDTQTTVDTLIAHAWNKLIHS